MATHIIANKNISELGLGCMSMSEHYGKPISGKAGIDLIAGQTHQNMAIPKSVDVGF